MMKVLAPAKVNLSLAITQKRADGFHELETVFQAISLYDIVEVSLTEKKGLTCLCGELSGEENLAYRAAQLFLEYVYQKHSIKNEVGVEIRIQKNIPVQAGLGGGSSDAAAVLRVMNQLFSNPLAEEELFQCAQSCGSDTAFFLKGKTQWGQKTGTDLTELPPLTEMDLILVKPSAGISTIEAYNIFDDIGSLGSLGYERWVNLLQGGDKQKIAQNLTNSLEVAAFKLLPELKNIKEVLLQNGCYGALMSGSGSVVFGILRDKKQGEEMVKRLTNEGLATTWLVKTIHDLPDIV